MDNNKIENEILKNFKLMNNLITQTPEEGEELPSDNKDDLYKLYINKAVRTILNLTNRIYFPEELKYIVLDMVNDFYTVSNPKVSNDANFVSSLEEEGRSVNFKNSQEETLKLLLSKHIAENTDMRQREIYRYRLLYKEMEKKTDNG